MAVYPRSKKNEIAGVLLSAASILLFLSLLSYQATDPSGSVSSSHHEYENIIGKFGAWIADFLFQFLGLAALLLPLPLLFAGYRKLRRSSLEYPYIKSLGFFCTLLAAATGLALVGPEMPGWVNFMSGGVVGVLLSERLLNYFNRTGTLIIVFSLLTLSLILTTRFSIDALLDWLCRVRWHPFSAFSTRIQHWRRRRKNRQELARLKQQKQEVVTKPLPNKISLEADGGGAVEIRGEANVVSVSLPHSPASELASGSQAVKPAQTTAYRLPSIDFLKEQVEETRFDEQQLLETARKLTSKCAEFEVNGRVLQIHPGPVVTTFEFKPDPGIKYSRITNLADDLCLALKAESIRIDRVPGKNTVGIEVPNQERRIIYLREALGSAAFQGMDSRLALGLGQLINGSPFVADLTKMPHLLIAGATGAGKSVGLNCMVCSILYKADPREVRFIMVDPKRLELGLYEDIPHLLTPIVTDARKAANALGWAVREMERRYKALAQQGVRNIAQFNQVAESGDSREGEELEHLPYIVIIVDELADLMMSAGKEVETSVTRLAQMARAVGIHLILATQRPSVDVITGLIKANFPCRISYRVSSKVDSRTILDANGAEQLLGMGDMLFLSPETARPIRIHGGFVSEKEIASITKFLRKQAEPDYREEVLVGDEDKGEDSIIDVSELEDKLYDEAARFVVAARRASTSLLQRRFRIGYGRAARLLDIMEHEGIVGPSEGSRPREILVPPEYFQELENS